VLLARRPEDGLARRDRLELALGAADTALAFEHRKDLRHRRRMADDAAACREPEDRSLDCVRRSQRRNRDSLQKLFARGESGLGVETKAFHSAARYAILAPMRRVGSVVGLLLGLLCTSAQAAPPTSFPTHVYAPYFETWTTDSLTTTAQRSSARYFTLAFLETLSKTSCTLAWNGSRNDPVSNGRYLTDGDVASLRALGGDVIPSFGGWSADQGGTEIADSCKDVETIAQAYEGVITRYDVTRLDMDVEGRSLNRTDGIDRRNKALKLVQDWAAAQRRPFQVSYTLPTSASGLEPTGLAILQNAITNGTRVDLVNIMAFDYYDRVTSDMGTAAVNAADGTVAQLRSIGLNAEIGITLMPGLDDYPKKTENTTLAHAQRVLDYAEANGVNTVSIWAIQRDNGGCPGVTGSNSCSGIVQNTWDFTHMLQPFTG
jgi:glycosyl hydrolase family 18 (putative chitinase)